MRWTRATLLTRALTLRTEKSCGHDASTPASSRRKQVFAGDGDKKARSQGRARRKPSKPLRARMPGVSGVLAVANARAFYPPRAAAGAMGTRRSPRPLGGEFIHNPGAERRPSGSASAHPSGFFMDPFQQARAAVTISKICFAPGYWLLQVSVPGGSRWVTCRSSFGRV